MSGRPLFAATPIEILTSKTLSSGAKNLYGVIAYTAGYPHMTRPTWYKNTSLARLMGCSPTALNRFKRELESMGVIERKIVKNICYLVPSQLSDISLKKLDPTVNNGARAILQKGLEGNQNWSPRVTESGHPGALEGPTERSNTSSMKHKRENNSGSVEPRVTPVDSMRRAGGIPKRKDRYEHQAEIMMGSPRRFDPEKMSPSRFYQRLQTLLINNPVVTSDTPSTGIRPSAAKIKIMKQTLEAYEKLNVTKTEFLRIIEWLIPGWENGLKRSITDQPFSIFTLLNKARKIIDLWRALAHPSEPAHETKNTEERKGNFIDPL